MLYYFDSSALVKRYATEQGSEAVRTVFGPEAGNTVYIGQIGVVEIAAALSKKVRTKELSQEDYQAVLLLFLTDVRNEEFTLTALNDHIVEFAVDLTKRFPLRGYDAVHLATAMILNNNLLEGTIRWVIERE